MRLVDADEIKKIYAGDGPGHRNLRRLGGEYDCGRCIIRGSRGVSSAPIADDEFGRIFAHDIRSIGVAFNAPPVSNGTPTSRSLILVTPDGERTMNTFLGISTNLEETQLDLELIRAASILYLEGYLFDRAASDSELFASAHETAKALGAKPLSHFPTVFASIAIATNF